MLTILCAGIATLSLCFLLLYPDLAPNLQCFLEGLITSTFVIPIASALAWLVKERGDVAKKRTNPGADPSGDHTSSGDV